MRRRLPTPVTDRHEVLVIGVAVSFGCLHLESSAAVVFVGFWIAANACPQLPLMPPVACTVVVTQAK